MTPQLDFFFLKWQACVSLYPPWNVTAASWELMPLLPSLPLISTWREHLHHRDRAFVTGDETRGYTVCHSLQWLCECQRLWTGRCFSLALESLCNFISNTECDLNPTSKSILLLSWLTSSYTVSFLSKSPAFLGSTWTWTCCKWKNSKQKTKKS